MAKRVSIELDDDLYLELVQRGGGVRKISGPANSLIRAGLAAERSAKSDPNALLSAQLADLTAQVARLAAVVADRER